MNYINIMDVEGFKDHWNIFKQNSDEYKILKEKKTYPTMTNENIKSIISTINLDITDIRNETNKLTINKPTKSWVVIIGKLSQKNLLVRIFLKTFFIENIFKNSYKEYKINKDEHKTNVSKVIKNEHKLRELINRKTFLEQSITDRRLPNIKKSEKVKINMMRKKEFYKFLFKDKINSYNILDYNSYTSDILISEEYAPSLLVLRYKQNNLEGPYSAISESLLKRLQKEVKTKPVT